MAWKRALEVTLAACMGLASGCGSQDDGPLPIPCELCNARDWVCSMPGKESAILYVDEMTSSGCRGRMLYNKVELRCDGQLCTDGYGCEPISVWSADKFDLGAGTCTRSPR